MAKSLKVVKWLKGSYNTLFGPWSRLRWWPRVHTGSKFKMAAAANLKSVKRQ